MVKTGRSVPASERLPHNVPRQRTKILSLLEKSSTVQSPVPQSPITNNQLPATPLPILNLRVDPTRCTACTLCAKFCPTGALKFLSNSGSFALTLQSSLCLGQDCNICVLACPEQAVSAQPFTESPNLFTKKPLVAGNLTPCQRCQQPIAQGPDLPTTCFACRPKTTGGYLKTTLS